MPRYRNVQWLNVDLANAASAAGHAKFSSAFTSAASSSSTSCSSVPPPLNLSTRDSTRVKILKQKLHDEQQHAVVLEQNIPGYRTSAVFFASLRTNLHLNASPPPSPLSTPGSMRASTGTLPPPSPLAVPAALMENEDVPPPAAAEDPLADVPDLSTYVTTDEEEQTAALKLVADSVAQMRQVANNSLIYHPLNLGVVVAILAVVVRYMVGNGHEPYIVGTTCTGAIMVGLVLIRYTTQDYLWAAEQINFNWLDNADVIVSKFGDEIIGAVVIEWISGESRQKRKKAWRGEIKAWTVRLKYRKKGVGAALLEEVANESRKKGAESVEFAVDHANSKRILPRFYNGKFDKTEKKAREVLQDQLQASPTKTRRKRGGST